MARPTKQGLDYFPLDVGFLQDVKIRRIMRACGTQSIPVLISLLANIYRNEGYFLRWDNDMPFLIADELGVSEGAVTETAMKAVQVDFFNANMYEQYSVLTSVGIQSRFFEACSRRSVVRYDARFLLINVSVYKNAVSVYNNSINVYDNRQSKVKESRVKESRVKESKVENRNDDTVKGISAPDAPTTPIYKSLKTYANTVRPIRSEIEKDQLEELIQRYGDDWVSKAIERAVLRNKRSLGYIAGILRRWDSEGYDNGIAPKKAPAGKQQAISDVMELLAEYEQEAKSNGTHGDG